jgi:3-methyladenine DNA glycosylase Tag
MSQSRAETFSVIYQRAAERKGGAAALEALLGQPLPAEQLARLPDRAWLSALTKKVFQSGFVWRVVEQKWPGFTEVFFQFEPEKMLLLSDEQLAAKAADPRIIRNATKVASIRHNAQMICDIAAKHGSFSKFVANWPSDDIIGLWAVLKKHGARLGGNTGPYALRAMGKDTFLLSQDVEAYLRAYGVVDGTLTSKSSLAAIQAQFNQWQQQSGRPMQQISQVVSMSVGDNLYGMVGATTGFGAPS